MNRTLSLSPAFLAILGITSFTILLIGTFFSSSAQDVPPDFSNYREYYFVDLDEVVLTGDFNAEDKIRKISDFREVSRGELEWDVEIVEQEHYSIDPLQLDQIPLTGPLTYEPKSIPGNLKVFFEPDGNVSYDYTYCDGIPFNKSLYSEELNRTKIWSSYTVGDPNDPTNPDYVYDPPRAGSTVLEVQGQNILVIHAEAIGVQNNLSLVLEVREDGFKTIYCGIIDET